MSFLIYLDGGDKRINHRNKERSNKLKRAIGKKLYQDYPISEYPRNTKYLNCRPDPFGYWKVKQIKETYKNKFKGIKND